MRKNESYQHVNVFNKFCRQSIPLKRNTKYLVRQHRMALVRSRTEVHHVKKVNLIVHGFLRNMSQVRFDYQIIIVMTKLPTITTYLYPRLHHTDTNCTYKFLATPNEQVTIVFDHFKVKADNANTTGGAYG